MADQPPDGDHHERRQPPTVTADENDDFPTSNGAQASNGNRAQPVKPRTPEPKNFGERLDWSKLEYGKKLIGWCIFFIIGLTLVSYFHPRDSGVINSSLEMLKLITTTALGFVFAKSIYDKDSNEPDD